MTTVDQVAPPTTTRTLRRPARRPVLVAVGLIAAGVAAPLVLPEFATGLLALWLPLVVLALSVNVLWGDNGIVSFGHGAAFAAGGYLAGIILKGPTADTTGTNMSILGTTSAEPSRYAAILEALHAPQIATVPILAIILPVVVCGAVGVLVGAVLFRMPSVEVYAPLITLGVGVLAAIGFLKLPQTGGSNGLSGIPPFLDGTDGYLFNLGWLVLIYALYWWLRTHRPGRIWRAAGDDPVRLEASGFPVHRIRAFGFGVSTALAGLAGALYVGASGFMSADFAAVGFSVQILIWVAIGRPGTLLGPLIGVLAIHTGEHYLSERLHDTWQLVLGLLLVVIVLAGRIPLPWRRRPAEATAS